MLAMLAERREEVTWAFKDMLFTLLRIILMSIDNFADSEDVCFCFFELGLLKSSHSLNSILGIPQVTWAAIETVAANEQVS